MEMADMMTRLEEWRTGMLDYRELWLDMVHGHST